jgi:hypothetical protein
VKERTNEWKKAQDKRDQLPAVCVDQTRAKRCRTAIRSAKVQRQVAASERLNAFVAWWSDESACQFMQVRRCINDRQLLATLEGESLGAGGLSCQM